MLKRKEILLKKICKINFKKKEKPFKFIKKIWEFLKNSKIKVFRLKPFLLKTLNAKN